MSGSLLRRVLVPVANEADVESTCAALAPYLGDAIEHVTVVHVIEQTPGFIDHASPEALEAEADVILSRAFELLEDRADVGTEIRYGSDLVEQIIEGAREAQATAIAFHPRRKGRLTRLLTEDAERRLLRESPLPVVALPGPDPPDSS